MKKVLSTIQFFVVVLAMLASPAFVLAKKPNDPSVTQWAYTDINLFDAWNYTTGSKQVVVAIIDNGFDTNHPDLKDNVWKNKKEIPNNKKDDDNNGYIDDVYGWNFVNNNNNPVPEVENLTASEKKEGVFHHGTVVAGLIGAVGNNGRDGAGVNWSVQLMNIKVLGNNGTGSIAPLGKAIDYAVNNGAHIINISMVGDETEEMRLAIKRAYEKGVVIVAAAGNDFTDLNHSPRYPICADAGAKEQMVIGVSAMQKSHQIAMFSNQGSNCIDMTAPGVQLGSTIRYAPDAGLTGTYADGWNGTSFATPLVSGTAALIKSVHPEWSAKQIISAMLSNTHKTPPEDETSYANLFGKGLLQVDKAIAYAASQAIQLSYASRFQRILGYDATTGDMREWNIEKETNAAFQQGAFRGIDDAITYRTKDDTLFATVVTTNKQARVRVYSSKWFLHADWTVSVPGEQQLVITNVVGDITPEIILASAVPEKTVFRVFALDGSMLSQYDSSAAHSGVSIATYPGAESAYDQLVTLYHNGTELVMERFSGLAVLEQSSPIGYIKHRGTIAIGDIDGDNQHELVVAAGKNELPFLLYYELSGQLKRQFFAYDPLYTGGMDVIVGDYDYDGHEDVVISPLSGGVPVRVFSGKVRKITEWWPFEDNVTVGVRLLGKRK